MSTSSFLPAVAVAVPALAIVPIALSRGRPALRESWTFGAALTLFAVVLWLLRRVIRGETVATPAVAFLPEAPLVLAVDALGMTFGLVASGLWVVTSLYSVGYMRGVAADHQTGFFAAFAASLSTAIGVAFAGNLVTLFVFYELLTLATYPLVVHPRTATARAAGRKYVLFTLGGGIAVLAGTVMVSGLAGSTTFTAGGLPTMLGADPLIARVAFALLAGGFGVKAALMPVHGWLPDAMVAPTPVSGLLHAVAVVKSGVFGIARVILDIYGPEVVRDLGVGRPLAVLAAVTMVLAAVIALRQDRLKRGLAYSTVSQLSYIVLGLALLTPAAVQGALLHLSAHAFMKIVLFFCAGLIYVETHVDRIDDLAGIGRRLPITMTIFAVASAGLIGLPLVAGFVSKWYLLTGMMGPRERVFGLTLLIAGLLKLLFFWPIVRAAFFPDRWSDALRSPSAVADGSGSVGVRERWERKRGRIEADWRLLLPVGAGILVAVVYGIVPTALPFYDLAAAVVEGAFP